MGVLLYDLATADDRRLSPYCWRAKLALAHKHIAFDTKPVGFSDIAAIGEGQTTVPVLDDNGHLVRDSFAIALYLEETRPDAPSLFKGEGGQAAARFVETWCLTTLQAAVFPLIALDIYNAIRPDERPYFRESRERRIGMSLEAGYALRDERLEAARATLTPVRHMLRYQAFFGGDAPLFADHVLFGALMWQRSISDLPLLTADDPVYDWMQRVATRYYAVVDKRFL